MATRIIGAILLSLFTLISLPLDARAGNDNPGVVPPGAKFRGLTYSQWAVKWWQEAFALPVESGDHPLISGGSFGGDRGVLFLSGVGGGVKIPLTVPFGTALFFPVVNTECSVIEPEPFHGDTLRELRECAEGHIDETSNLSAAIDHVPVQHLDAYRIEPHLFRFGPLPEDNLLAFFGVAAPAGAKSWAADAGVYLLVRPLPPGKHVIQFRASGIEIDTKYVIHVTP